MPPLGVKIDGKTWQSIMVSLSRVCWKRSAPYSSPESLLDARSPHHMSIKHPACLSKEQLQHNMEKKWALPLHLCVSPPVVLSSGNDTTIHTVSRNVGILCHSLLSLPYYIQLSTRSYNFSLLMPFQFPCRFPNSGYQDVWLGLLCQFPKWAPYFQSCPTRIQLLHIRHSDLSIVKFA